MTVSAIPEAVMDDPRDLDDPVDLLAGLLAIGRIGSTTLSTAFLVFADVVIDVFGLEVCVVATTVSFGTLTLSTFRRFAAATGFRVVGVRIGCRSEERRVGKECRSR